MELFLKRSEGGYKAKIGEQKTDFFFEKLRRAMLRIPEQFSNDLGSEIPKLLFKISQEIDNLKPENIEAILNHILYFTYSLYDLKDEDRNQVHQTIITRSKSAMRSLLDILNNLVDKAKNNEIMEISENFEDILSFLAGESLKATKFDNIDIFFKKAEKNFAKKIAENKIKDLIEKIINSNSKISREFKDQISSEIAKYLFKFSQNIKEFSNETLLNILNHVLLFTDSISDLKGKNRDQTNQHIIKRSKNKCHGLFDLFLTFLEKAKNGEILNSAEDLEQILTFIFGTEEDRIQFKDVGGFLKRAQSKYAEEIGEQNAEALITELLNALQEIPVQFGAYLASDISRYLFNYSNTIEGLNPTRIEKVLKNTLTFIYALNEVDDFSNEQMNQYVINRSNHEIRNLFDLYKKYIEKNIEQSIKIKEPNFDDIVIFTLGTYVGPKTIEEANKIHELLADYHNEFPLAKEHYKWVDSILTIIPRFLEVLQNEEGNQIIDIIWENKLPNEQIIIGFLEKINELPRDDEKKFLFKLLHLLTWQILIDEEQDRALTGAVSFTILAKIFVDIFNGRNSMIRAIKINELLNKRDNVSLELKKEIDYHIQKILEEDFKSIQRRFIPIKEIISVAYTKGFYIKTFDFIQKDYPEIIKKTVSSENSLKYIGNQYIDSFSYGEMISELKEFLDELDFVKDFYDKFMLESINIPSDATVKSRFLIAFLGKLINLKENFTPHNFYDKQILISEHSIYLLIIKYLSEHLKDFFEKIKPIFEMENQGMTIISMARYLSKMIFEENEQQIKEIEKEIDQQKSSGLTEDSESLSWLLNSLELRNNDKQKFIVIENIFYESERADEHIDSKIDFSKLLLDFLDNLKNIHQNLPAALIHSIKNIKEFGTIIDYFIEEIKKSEEKGLISPDESIKIENHAKESINQLNHLISDETFMIHINNIQSFKREEVTEPQVFEDVSEDITEDNMQAWYEAGLIDELEICKNCVNAISSKCPICEENLLLCKENFIYVKEDQKACDNFTSIED